MLYFNESYVSSSFYTWYELSFLLLPSSWDTKGQTTESFSKIFVDNSTTSSCVSFCTSITYLSFGVFSLSLMFSWFISNMSHFDVTDLIIDFVILIQFSTLSFNDRRIFKEFFSYFSTIK